MARTKTADNADVKRRPRRKKDKNAPKRALSAFMFFSNDIRDQVKKEMPGKCIQSNDISRFESEYFRT